MGPWLLVGVLVAATNLFVFVAVRGRWGRIVAALAVAALAGTLAGDVVAARTGLELVRLGDFHLVAASVGAQLAMLATTLLATIGPVRVVDDEGAARR